jgi:protein gp37
MADLFGDWVSDVWICHILNQIVRPGYSHHTYQFLTKNPQRLKDFNPWPSNCWVGTTVTNQADADERLHWLLQVDAPVLFVSHEPLLSEIYLAKSIPCADCDGSGYLGICQNKKKQSCERCGGDEDSLGHGIEPGISWAIIGAQTGPGAMRPDNEWVSGLIRQYRAAGVPIFLKDNLYPPGASSTVKYQEFPA